MTAQEIGTPMYPQRVPRGFGIALALLVHIALIQGLTHVTRHSPTIAEGVQAPAARGTSARA